MSAEAYRPAEYTRNTFTIPTRERGYTGIIDPTRSRQRQEDRGNFYIDVPALPGRSLNEARQEALVEREFLSGNGERLLVPVGMLSGSQGGEAYKRSRRRAVEKMFKDQGVDFLKEHPVIACFIPAGYPPEEAYTDFSYRGKAQYSCDFSRIVLMEGHHRARYAPNFGIYEVPTLLYTPEQATTHLNNIGETYKGRKFTPAKVVQWLDEGTEQSDRYFRTYPDYRREARLLTDVHSIDDLRTVKSLKPF